MDRIQSLGSFVQSFRYVEIATGIGRGGGYRPRAASDVFVKQYGDCKDKATLMRALLKAAGIDSYLVLIYATDRTYVREDWPSPQQFNHAIVAVKISDRAAGPVIDHPTLGHLLLFDPTSSTTPPGDLPLSEQSSPALIVAGDRGELLRTPSSPPSANVLERQIEASLDPEGSLSAHLTESARGQAAASARRGLNTLARAEYDKGIEQWISATNRGARISAIAPSDNFLQGQFALKVDFVSPGYAQVRANRLMIFKPAIVMSRLTTLLTDRKRNSPILLNAWIHRDTARIKLPPGFQVDELPDPAKLETPFAKYTATCEAKDGEIVFSRRLEIGAATIPADQYAAVRQFYEHVLAAEQSAVVLVKK